MLTELAEATGGMWAGGTNPPSDRWFSGIGIDTRTLKAGDVFFCLKGGRTDGHRFARNAARRKAAAIIARRSRPGFSRPILGVPVLRVENPLIAGETERPSEMAELEEVFQQTYDAPVEEFN